MKSQSDGRGFGEDQLRDRGRASAASASTASVTAGRPFFMIVGVSVTSRAPAANRRSTHVVVDLRIEVVDIGGDFDQVVGVEGGALATDHQAQHVGPIGEVLGAGAIADALDFEIRSRRPGRASAFRIAAPVGVTISDAPSPIRSGKPASNSAVAGAGTGMMPCCERAKPLPIGSGETSTSPTSKLVERPRGADDVDDRIDRADLVEVDVVGGGVVDLGFGLGQHLEDRDRATLDAQRTALRAIDHRANLAEVALGLRRRSPRRRTSVAEIPLTTLRARRER